MSVYTARLFAKSNSSISLRTGQALKASINKLGVMDTGLGKPVSCSENELVRSRSPATDGSRNATVGYLDRSEARLGFLHALRSITGTSTAGAFRPQSIPSLRDCELIFVDLMAGDDFARSRALSRAKDILGCPSLGEEGSPLVIPPRSFRQMRVWVEIHKAWRYNKKVKGFILDKVQGGYAVAIAGFIAFLPGTLVKNKTVTNYRYIIENINPRNMSIVVR
eukprot:TRINITY_DN3292_c0_g1_i1.p1 TRINITY_DN3292_c0_g1~~TRINITY_DN3292_c0_g1_i1.p1  ORF type:complete len:222 (-),score=11.49 TRINITY_DN3292_c0_g1_i1:347-1012(-)